MALSEIFSFAPTERAKEICVDLLNHCLLERVSEESAFLRQSPMSSFNCMFYIRITFVDANLLMNTSIPFICAGSCNDVVIK